MRERKEQMSKEFADKLLDEYYFGASPDDRECKRVMKERWKALGYIKQSREGKIREELKELDDGNISFPNYKHYYFKAIELIEILDNKEKDK